MPEKAPLEIRLFGANEVRVCGREIKSWPSRRAAWLLGILALRENRPIERQRLAGMLWPDSSDPTALHNLRQTLTALRRVLGEASECIVSVSPRSLVLKGSPSVWVDVLEFDSACREGGPEALEAALDLFREPLLSGCGEPFAIEARELRDQAFVDATKRIADVHLSRGQFGLAAARLRRGLKVNPYDEAITRTLMTSLDKAGEPSAALEAFRDLRSRLRQDLRSEPVAATKALYQSIRTRPVSSSERGRRHRLPKPLSLFVGREADLAGISRLLGRCRLVTLTGVGGVGKTRLAIATAVAVKDRYLDGAWFVDLASLQDATMVASAIAGVLEISLPANKPLISSLVDGVRSREMLLVLDNCEQLGLGFAEIVETLLSEAPGLHVLATSRQSLGVAGEQVWRVEPLMESDAVTLFLDRSSRRHDPRLVQTPVLAAIGSICEKLEGIPLAIELAAARTSVLSEKEIEVRLQDRFALLGAGPRTSVRHQSLHAAIEWSWDLLSEAEQSLLMRLSVFRGGWSLEAADAIGDGQLSLDLMTSLVDRSLVNSSAGEDIVRFSMLETIRQFSLEKLRKDGGFKRTSEAHRDYFLAWAEESRLLMESVGEKETFELFEREHDNLRASLAWSIENDHGEPALRLCYALARFWDTHGHVNEGRIHFDRALGCNLGGISDELIGTVHGLAGWAATLQRDADSAREHYGQALAMTREAGLPVGVGKWLNCLGMSELYAGEYEAAERAFREVLEIGRSLERPTAVAAALSNLAEVALSMGNFKQARVLLEESLASGESVSNGEQFGQSLCCLSLVEIQEGLVDGGRALAVKALRLFVAGDLSVDIPIALNQVALADLALGETMRGAKLAGAAEALANAQGAPLASFFVRARDEAVGASVEAFREGQGLTMSEAVSLAMA